MDSLFNPYQVKSIHFNLNKENFKDNLNTKYNYYYNFDIKYEILSPIVKDIQMVSQLIKCIKNYQLSDLIFIYGSNSYSIKSQFYFNYRVFIDFYLKVIDFIETDYYIETKYNIYKTKPISKNFFVNISLFKNDENDNSSKLKIEIILPKEVTINQRILNIIYNEFDYNFQYLSQAIKLNKNELNFYSSSTIKIEFNILEQIIQNVKLIEYIINGKLEKIINNDRIKESNNYESNNNINDNKNIHLKDIYKININKKKEINKWLSVNNICIKIQLLIARGDKIIIQFKIITSNQDMNENDISQNNNFITIQVRKLTKNTSFILIKAELNGEFPEKIKIELQKIIKKSINKIEKLSQITKNNF